MRENSKDRAKRPFVPFCSNNVLFVIKQLQRQQTKVLWDNRTWMIGHVRLWDTGLSPGQIDTPGGWAETAPRAPMPSAECIPAAGCSDEPRNPMENAAPDSSMFAVQWQRHGGEADRRSPMVYDSSSPCPHDGVPKAA